MEYSVRPWRLSGLAEAERNLSDLAPAGAIYHERARSDKTSESLRNGRWPPNKACLRTSESEWGQLVGYAELLEPLGIFTRESLHLIYIRDEVCRKHGRPWLNALVVLVETGMPSDGWAPECIVQDGSTEHWWRGMVHQVHEYNWSDVELE